MKALGLHQMCALDSTPLELLEIAAATGCQEVSLFVNNLGLQGAIPLVTEASFEAVLASLKAKGLRVGNVEAFMIMPQYTPETFTQSLHLAARLGARGATALLMDPDKARLTNNLRNLCDQARALGLNVNIEFLALMPFWNTVEEVNSLIADVDRDNLKFGLDLLHLVRSGTGLDVFNIVPAERMGYAQLCDGKSLEVTTDYGVEASVERVTPGEGVFPLEAFLRALPDHVVIELEVPQCNRNPAAQRCASIVDGARAMMAKAGL